MLNRLDVENFTVFHQATFQFGRHLNVIHGVNGTGKTHVLKLAYALQHALASKPATASRAPSKEVFQRTLAEELVEVFQPDALGRLVTRSRGRGRASVAVRFKTRPQRTAFTLHTASRTEVKLDTVPVAWLDLPPVFLPTREALTLFPGFVSLYDSTEIGLDRTWRDLCLLLGRPLSRGPKAAHVRALLAPLEEVMSARVILDPSGYFYLKDDRGIIEMHLVAEGMRKLAMVAQLISNGSLAEKGCLLWDEPEANLNPVLVKKVAALLMALARQGVQVFVATHSLFLMRELHILQAQVRPEDRLDCRYFGLHLSDEGVTVKQGPDIADSGDVAALDQELAQADRYIDSEMGASTQPSVAETEA